MTWVIQMERPQCTGHPMLSCSVKSLGWNLTSRVCSCTVCNQNKEAAATVAMVAMSFPFPGKVMPDGAT